MASQTEKSNAKLLLLEPDKALALEITEALQAYGYDLIEVKNVDQAMEILKHDTLDAALIDLDCGKAQAGQECLEHFASIRPFTLPMAIMLGSPDVQLKLRAIRAGCSAIFTKPLDFQILVSRLQALIQPPEVQPFRILVVEDSRTQAMYLQRLLESAGMIVHIVLEPLKALNELNDFQADLILLDHYMPGCDGPELATLIRLNPAYLSIPIVYLSTEMDASKQLRALQKGADDFLTKSIQPEHLISSVQIRAERTRLLRSQMLHDSLTGLLNHTTLKFRLREEVSRAERYGSPLACAMIDLDHFKAVNDTHGHAMGDHVLLALSTMLLRRLRRSDIIGRYGGEEFSVVLPQTNLEGARIILEQMRGAFGSIPHLGLHGPFHVTFSCGVAEYKPGMNADALSAAADAAMYEAKRGGRNRIAVA